MDIVGRDDYFRLRTQRLSISKWECYENAVTQLETSCPGMRLSQVKDKYLYWVYKSSGQFGERRFPQQELVCQKRKLTHFISVWCLLCCRYYYTLHSFLCFVLKVRKDHIIDIDNYIPLLVNKKNVKKDKNKGPECLINFEGRGQKSIVSA